MAGSTPELFLLLPRRVPPQPGSPVFSWVWKWDGEVYVRTVLHYFHCWSFFLGTFEVFALGLSLGFVFILHLKGGEKKFRRPRRDGLGAGWLSLH